MDIYLDALKHVVAGIPATLTLSIESILIALILGVLLSAGITRKSRIMYLVFSFINSFLKGVPILVFLYVFNSSIDLIMGGVSLAIPFYSYDIRKPPTFLFAVFALALSYAPYMCDMITTALSAIPKGQAEACDSMGFSTWSKMTRIMIPQCVVMAVPIFGNHFVNLLKATSLTCMVTIMEMMGEARNNATMTQMFLENYIVCALCYWIIFILFEKMFSVIEKRTGSYLRPGYARKK